MLAARRPQTHASRIGDIDKLGEKDLDRYSEFDKDSWGIAQSTSLVDQMARSAEQSMKKQRKPSV